MKEALEKLYRGIINLIVTFCIMAMPVVAIAYASSEPANDRVTYNSDSISPSLKDESFSLKNFDNDEKVKWQTQQTLAQQYKVVKQTGFLKGF